MILYNILIPYFFVNIFLLGYVLYAMRVEKKLKNKMNIRVKFLICLAFLFFGFLLVVGYGIFGDKK